MISSQILCHHAPYIDGEGRWEAGVYYIPLFNLVYHDCVIIPWYGSLSSRGAWGIPSEDHGYLHALLNGNPVGCGASGSDEYFRDVRTVCATAARLVHAEMVRHDFLSEDCRCQRTVFSDGTEVTVDFDSGDYRVSVVR